MHKAKTKTNYSIKKSAARLYAIQALFQMEASKSSFSEIVSEFESHRIGSKIDGTQYHFADLEMFKELLKTAVQEQSKIDTLTNKSLKESWHLNRIDPTLRAIFRAATAELILRKTPPKATLNEFINLAEAFFPEGKEKNLVNGVLDKILILMNKSI